MGIPGEFMLTFKSGAVSIAGGDSWVGIPNGVRYVAHAVDVSIAGGDSWVGILLFGYPMPGVFRSFNRRWRFLGGDTPNAAMGNGQWHLVSIAGGDSWVGILQV